MPEKSEKPCLKKRGFVCVLVIVTKDLLVTDLDFM